MTTIKDIAKKLQLSTATVSRALNGKCNVTTETRKLVEETAKELGYHPNFVAKNLKKRCSKTIGVVIPEIVNPFFAEVYRGIQDVLLAADYHPIIIPSNEDAETEKKVIELMLQHSVDGLLLSLTRESNEIDYLKKLVKADFPIVLFNRIAHDLEVSKVVFNDFKWSYLATEHLIKQGYRRIQMLAIDKNLHSGKERIRGFKKAHEKYGIRLDPNQIQITGLTIAEGEARSRAILDAKGPSPDAFFCNDQVALGVLKTLHQRGINVPDAMGLMAFNDNKFLTITTPTLSAVNQPTYTIGESAAQLLLQKIADHKIPNRVLTLEGELITRSSSQKAAYDCVRDGAHV